MGLGLSRSVASVTYRPDIDGLRAIAVGAVVLYHAGIAVAGGGYVGVDVFFVISGYLITRLLAESGARDLRSQLAEFYLRRARRILPALFVASAAAALAALLLLQPWDLDRFAKYLLATPVFLSNIPPWLVGGNYFDSRTAPVALTHLWSIAVEEQFYLVYPLALWLIGRHFPRQKFAALGMLAGASLALCIWASYHLPAANYFLAPSRAWELLLGALLAAGESPRHGRRWIDEVLAIAALLTLLGVIVGYGAAARYPGIYTLIPCAATALLIMTGGGRPTLAGRLLSLSPLVFTGLISYSIYLWHMPVLAFFRYYNIWQPGAAATSALLACVYLLAVLSWRFVEQPIRYRSLLETNASFVRSAAACGLILLAAGLAMLISTRVEWGVPGELQIPDREWLAGHAEFLRCTERSADEIALGDLCSYGPMDAQAPTALVWGDSHAISLRPAYERIAMARKARIYFAIKPGCRPLVGLAKASNREPGELACAAFNAAAVRAIHILAPQVVILNARWTDPDAQHLVQSAGASDDSDFKPRLEQTLSEIGADRRPACVVLDVPAYGYDIPYALAMARMRGLSEDFLKLSRADALAEFREHERDFLQLRQRELITTVDPKDLLCSADYCSYESDGHVLYGDRDHLSKSGALFVSSVLEECFRGIQSRDSTAARL
jgi:peptidoglycan/LPS O-acetylase OafA/YrhL